MSYKAKLTKKTGRDTEGYGYSITRNASTKPIIGRVAYGRKPNSYGHYASPYYDPVKRKERYEASKTHPTRPYGVGASASSGSVSGKGSGGGKGGKGSGGKGGKGSGGKGGKGSGGGKGSKGKKNAYSDAINRLREESSLNTAAQNEATRRKIADLRAELGEQVRILQGRDPDSDSINIAEVRSRIQNIKNQILASGQDLSKWVNDERDALQKRIASLTGTSYNPKEEKQKAKQQQEKRNKEVNSRADAIYKRKTKK